MNKFRFNKNIDRISKEDVEKMCLLPLAHNTDIANYQNILNSERLVPKECDVFKERITYFFYGLPIYAKKNWSYPVFMFFKTSDTDLDVKGVYPLDTGGLFYGIITDRNKSKETPSAEDIKMYFNCAESDEHHITSRKIVKAFFDTNENYLRGKMTVEREQFKTFYGIEYSNFTAIDSDYFIEERAKAIEIHNHSELKLEDTKIELLILPEEYYGAFKEETEKIFDQENIKTYNAVIRGKGIPRIIEFAQESMVEHLSKKKANV